MAKVLFATQFYEPEPVMKGEQFASDLAAAGHDVTVVTGLPNYPHGSFYDGFGLRSVGATKQNALNVVRLPLYPYHGASFVGRTANYLTFAVSLAVWGLVNARRYDVIYVYHPPITVGLAVSLFSWLYRIPFVLDVQDLWPDSVVHSNIGGVGSVARILDRLCRIVYSRASKLVAQSNNMKGILECRGVYPEKIEAIFNWSLVELKEVAPTLESNRLQLHYTGNIGPYQNLDAIIDAVVIARKQGVDVCLELIGHGSEKDRLLAKLDASAARYVTFRQLMPRDELVDYLQQNSDGCVFGLADLPFFEATLPSKLPFYLSLGKPILAMISGEANDIVRECHGGFASAANDVQTFAKNIQRLAEMTPAERLQLAANGHSYYHANLSRAAAMRTTVRLLQETLDE